jgi:sulfide:quinone oxidoreductase
MTNTPMHVKRLAPDLAVGPQITEGDVETIARLGFRSIISNRPDGESAEQLPFAALKAKARQHGVETRHVPVVATRITDADVEEFRQALRELPKPILAFCRTGTRAALLWALANKGSLTAEERMRSAAAHGYDLSAFRERIERL